MTWEIKLRTITQEAQTGPFGSQLHAEDYIENGIPVINPSNIVNGKLAPDASIGVLPGKASELRRHALQDGDLIFARRGELGRAAVVQKENADWLCGTGSIRVRLRPGTLDAEFAKYAIQSHEVGWYFQRQSVGSTMGNINTSIVLGLSLSCPPLEEQRRISDFLDAETSLIDALIGYRQRQRQLIKERYEGLMTSCCSFDGANNIQHPLLGGIAPEWKVLSLRRVVSTINVGVVVNPSSYFTDSGVPFIHGFNVREGFIDSHGMKYLSTASNEILHRSQVRAGDVLIVRAGAPGRAAVVPPELDRSNCASVLILRRNEGFVSKFLEVFINSPAGKGQVAFSQYGAAQGVISAAQVASFTIPFPPFDEQQRRVRHFSKQTKTLSKLISGLEKQVNVLRERRQALITAAVTGQFDVSTASGRGVME